MNEKRREETMPYRLHEIKVFYLTFNDHMNRKTTSMFAINLCSDYLDEKSNWF